MANEKHLAILKQGVEAWNQWRKKHPSAKPKLSNADLSHADLRGANLGLADLSGAYLNRANLGLADLSDADLSDADLRRANLGLADLSGAYLGEAHLSNADLSGAYLGETHLGNADLSGAYLRGANLRGANLIQANLSRADLSEAHLGGANLGLADLSGADLNRANLIEVRLGGAKLIGADLIEARLGGANLSGADLSLADLRGADLRGADLRGADLIQGNLGGAKLIEANLSEADLGGAKLRGANLSEADLIEARLGEADLSGADLTRTNLFAARVLNANFNKVTLTGACIADWQIGSSTRLANIRCDYIFRTFNPKTKTFSGRLPVDPRSTFTPGEFEQWVKVRESSLETIDLTFTEGIDWQAFFNSFQEVRQQHPNSGISMQSIEEKDGTYVVRLRLGTEAIGEDLEKLRAEVETKTKALYELQRQFHKSRGEIQALERSLDKALEKLAMTNNHTQNTTFNPQGANIYGGLAGKNYGKMLETQYNYASKQKQSLAEAAAEIRGILEELEQFYPTNTTAEKMTVAAKAIERIEGDPTFKLRVTNAVKEGGLKAFERAIDNSFGAFVAGAVESWQDAEAEQTG